MFVESSLDSSRNDPYKTLDDNVLSKAYATKKLLCQSWNMILPYKPNEHTICLGERATPISEPILYNNTLNFILRL
jgi:hypothetical protein